MRQRFLIFFIFHLSIAMEIPSVHFSLQTCLENNEYFYDLQKASSYEDTKPTAELRSSLFVQLFVQASKAKGQRLKAFNELLNKVKQDPVFQNNVVQTSPPPLLTITHKDLCYRLLASIPNAQPQKLPIFEKKCASLINGKEVDLHLHTFETEEDKLINCQNKSKNYSGVYLLSSAYFELDKIHHARVIQEFRMLVNG